MEKATYTFFGLLLLAGVMCLPCVIETMATGKALLIILAYIAALAMGVKLVNRYGEEA